MQNSFDFTVLIEKQRKLDALIASNHNITYETTRIRRTLALFVEIGEFANTTRCFKYWSNKPMDDKAIVLDEYADGLHFFLSLGIDVNSDKTIYERSDNKLPLSDQIVKTYELISEFAKTYSVSDYQKAFSYFLNISYTLGYEIKEVVDAYETKLKENYRRQNTNY